ncbi:MAG: metallophosphoesterase [Algisphaera sp.]
MSEVSKIALIGDVHLFDLAVHPRRLISRRAMAHANLLMNRQHRFNHGLLPHLVDRVKAIKPDLALFSGDVSTSSLEREFEDLIAVFRPLVDEVPCVLVPGNHDRYTFKSRRVKRIETLLHEVMPDAFPHVRQLAPGWSLLALDSAIPNRLFSRGALGADQLKKALAHIAAVPEDQALLVLCHYPCTLPPRVPHAWSHDLKEAEPLKQALMACRGRVVYLHGHIHKPWHALADAGEKPAFECINAGSPCMTSPAWPLGQGFWELDLPTDPRGALVASHHALSEESDSGGSPVEEGMPGGTPRTPVWKIRQDL